MPMQPPSIRLSGFQNILLMMLALIGASSCEEAFVPVPSTTVEAYFPLSEGRTWTYTVDTIHYREIGGNDTSRWELQEVLGAPFTDLSGGTSYTVERYRRPDTSLPWRYLSTATVRWEAGQLFRQDNNLSILKLVGPLQADQQWQGHIPLADLSSIPTAESCNNWRFLEGWTFWYSNLDTTLALGGQALDSVLTVRQAGEQNLIEHNDGFERYAQGIGLVERSFRHLTTQSICPECPWSEKAECGFAVHAALTAWTE